MMKCASAILRRKRIYIQGYSPTVPGFWMATGVVYTSDDSDIERLGQNVLAALSEASTTPIPGPADRKGWKEVQRPMLEAAGVRSWSALAKGAKPVGIEMNGKVVTITPSKDYANQGPSLEQRAIRSDANVIEVGRSLLLAFAACE